MLQNNVAIITGSSRGIGEAIAHNFAAHGATLILVATTSEGERLASVKAAASAHGVAADILAGDIADPEFSDEIVRHTLATYGHIDTLVNCAGIISRQPIEDLPHAEWHRVIDVNLHGTYYLSRAALPAMRTQRRGSIINISSQMAKMPHPSASPSYEVSKAGQLALTRHLAYHYAQYNVRVNAIAPGSINTDMPKSMSATARERLIRGIPLGRLGEPFEVAECARFLASSMSEYITGEVIDINGGSLID